MVELLEETRTVADIILRKIRENKTEIYVPDPKHYKKKRTDYLPSTLPVWYNPRMEINRDITIIAIQAYKNIMGMEDEIVYIEGLAGTGIRGFRVYNELVKEKNIPIEVIINDVDETACELLKYNHREIGEPREMKIYCEDYNYLLHKYKREKENIKKHIDIIELDPYGTPMPFVATTAQYLKGKNGLLIASATDQAPLYGKQRESALRKYASWLKKTKFSPEIGTRTLIYAIGKEFTIFSKNIEPLFAIVYDGFIKIIARVQKGKLKANKFWTQIGFLEYDPENPYKSRLVQATNFQNPEKEYIGPTWIGTLANEEFCQEMLNALKSTEIKRGNKRALERFLKWLIEGADMPLYIDINDIAKQLKKQPPPMEEIVEKLNQKGIRATRTFFNYNAIKIENLEKGEDLLKQVI